MTPCSSNTRLLATALATGAVAIGCGPAGRSTGTVERLVTIDLVRGVSWDFPQEGYDPALPGYHLAGGIGTVRLTAPAPPEEFVLEIRTTVAHRPNLEGFTVRWADTLLQMAPFADGAPAEILPEAEGETGLRHRFAVDQSYFTFSREESVVRVRFLPPALVLIAEGCTVSWVDWYRR